MLRAYRVLSPLLLLLLLLLLCPNLGLQVFCGREPHRGTETCAVVEAMASLEYAFTTLGDPLLMDRVERLAFNAMPAALTADMWTHVCVEPPSPPLPIHSSPYLPYLLVAAAVSSPDSGGAVGGGAHPPARHACLVHPLSSSLFSQTSSRPTRCSLAAHTLPLKTMPLPKRGSTLAAAPGVVATRTPPTRRRARTWAPTSSASRTSRAASPTFRR